MAEGGRWVWDTGRCGGCTGDVTRGINDWVMDETLASIPIDRCTGFAYFCDAPPPPRNTFSMPCRAHANDRPNPGYAVGSRSGRALSTVRCSHANSHRLLVPLLLEVMCH